MRATIGFVVHDGPARGGPRLVRRGWPAAPGGDPVEPAASDPGHARRNAARRISAAVASRSEWLSPVRAGG
jgi:hypothetical protein